MTVEAVSSLWETEPVGLREQPLFLNAALRGQTTLLPRALLGALIDIEERLGRRRRVRNGPREVDLDLLGYDALAVDEPGLTLPHPRVGARRFVLAPLAEIAADARMAPGEATVGGLLAALRASEAVKIYPVVGWPPPLS